MGTELTGITHKMMKIVGNLIFCVYIEYATTYILIFSNSKARHTFRGIVNIWCLEDSYNNKTIPFFKPVYYNKQISSWIQDY